MYEKILNDQKIIKLYNHISAFEDRDKGWAHHNLIHVTNVAKMLELILRQLRYEEEYIDEAKVCRSSEKNRFQNSLTVSNVMISSVVSDTFGKTSQSILQLMLSKDNVSLEDIIPLLKKT